MKRLETESLHRFRWSALAATCIALGLAAVAAGSTNRSSGGGATAQEATAACRGAAAIDNTVVGHFLRLEAYGFAGTIVIRQGGCSFSHAFGIADRKTRRAVTEQTAFDVGSITKFYTASAILVLRDRGALDLDASINRYLPGVPADKSTVTVRSLIAHTSGLADDYWDSAENRGLGEDQYVTEMLQRPLESAPGTEYRYSNFGYHVLKRIIERVSGASYEAFLAKEILAPLGLKDTGLSLPGWDVTDLAFYQESTTRSWTEQGIEVANGLKRPIFLRPEGSGYLYATAADLSAFVRAVAQEKVVRGGFSAFKQAGATATPFMGLDTANTSLGPEITKGGYDDSIGTVARFAYFPEVDLSYVLLSNTHFGGLLTAEIAGFVVDAAILGGEAVLPPATVPPLNDDAALAGTYQGPWGGALTIAARDGRLYVVANDEQAVSALLLPALWADDEVIAADPRISRAIAALEANKPADLYPLLIEEVRNQEYFDSARKRWQQTVESHGPLRSLRMLHARDTIAEGEHERWLIYGGVHENGRSVGRVYEYLNGLLLLSRARVPATAELQLAAIGLRTYAVWDPYLAVATVFQLGKDGRTLTMKQLYGPAIKLSRKP